METSIKNCKGDEAKKQIVEEYDIYPISFVKLLEGQKREGCCGTLKDVYYTFSAINKETKKEESFFVGKSCAEQFLELLKLKKLPLFNPLTAINDKSKSATNNDKKENSKEEIDKVLPINRELLNAIALLSIIWDDPLESMQNICKFSIESSKPNENGIIWFNEKVKKYSKGKTLTQMCDELREKYPNFKVYNFDNLRKVLLEKKIKEKDIFL
jgi:hypothetical protein